ncbi:MAG: RNA polymerase sigma factor [Cyclobacteriaceae bacterium]|nr:RNA polymerase sigma factor [Cyclobacteriaceae bacterium]
MEVNLNIHQDIIDRCIDGERGAYYELYKLYSKAMFNVSLRIIGRNDEAEDVLQEAFISAFNHIKSFKGSSTFGAWLKRIVVNKAISHVKKNKLDVVNIDEHPVDDISDDDQEEVIYDVEGVKLAINKLPEGYRVVFSLYLLEGYDHKEIAEILNITESTSKSQYNRAKKKLKEILKEEVAYETRGQRSS